jgi:hypothetical protein
VLGGDRDGSWDALREGRLGVAVDPDDEDALLRGLEDVLGRPRARNAEVDAFRYDRFAAQAAALVLDLP